MLVTAVAIAAVAALLAPGAPVADAAEAPSGLQAPATFPSIAFPASVPVGGTGLIVVNYTEAPFLTASPGSATAGGGFVLLRFPAGIEVASPGYAVYPGT